MWQIAIRRLEMPVVRFITLYVGGAFVGGLLASLLLIFITGGFADGALFAGFSGVLLLFLLPIDHGDVLGQVKANKEIYF